MFTQEEFSRLQQGVAELSRAFQTGVDAALDQAGDSMWSSPRETVHERDRLKLYRYPSRSTDGSTTRPMLLVYALVNRPYILDIEPERSLVQRLCEQGIDVYLIDWGYPLPEDRSLSLEDYVNDYIDSCVQIVGQRHGQASVDVLGVCQGGVLSLIYAALKPDRVRNLITMVTPVDCHTPDNLLSRWVRSIDLDCLVDAMGNVPGWMLNSFFLGLKPLQLTADKYFSMSDVLSDERKARRFLKMERWLQDCPDQAGVAFRQFVGAVYQRNCLVEGGMFINGCEVDLAKLHMPILNIYARQDHIVPPSASRPLKALAGTTDYTEIAHDSGHIGIFVGASTQETIAPAIAQWLSARSV